MAVYFELRDVRNRGTSPQCFQLLTLLIVLEK